MTRILLETTDDMGLKVRTICSRRNRPAMIVLPTNRISVINNGPAGDDRIVHGEAL